MTGDELDQRLRRIEGMLGTLIRDQAEQQEQAEEAAAAYRRGYLVGRQAARRGDPCDPDGALERRRSVRA